MEIWEHFDGGPCLETGDVVFSLKPSRRVLTWPWLGMAVLFLATLSGRLLPFEMQMRLLRPFSLVWELVRSLRSLEWALLLLGFLPAVWFLIVTLEKMGYVSRISEYLRTQSGWLIVTLILIGFFGEAIVEARIRRRDSQRTSERIETGKNIGQ